MTLEEHLPDDLRPDWLQSSLTSESDFWFSEKGAASPAKAQEQFSAPCELELVSSEGPPIVAHGLSTLPSTSVPAVVICSPTRG